MRSKTCTILIFLSACIEPTGDILCRMDAGQEVCAAVVDDQLVRVIKRDTWDAAVSDGRYVDPRDPACEASDEWASVVCYTAVSVDDVVCVGEMADFYVGSADPCDEMPIFTVDVFGLYAWPENPTDYGQL